MQSGSQPLYVKVKDHILKHIRSGKWLPEQRIPSEHELVRELNVSRMTANRALRELTGSGVLRRIAGVGTFVADFRAAGHPLRIRNIADEIRERGHAHRAEVKALRKLEPPPEIRERLALPRGTASIFQSVIVHYENDLPLQVEDRYVNPAVAPGYLKVDFRHVTPYEHLMEVAPLQRVEHVVRAVLPPAPVRRWLELTAGEPSLLVERVTWSRGVRASYALLHHPGRRFELSGGFDP
jgi:GntR family histidine utilization transcriptional repressor